MTTARPLLLIVPSADDRPTTHRLLGVAAALAEDPTVDLTVLLWAGGSSAEAFAALSPTIDAASVNQWKPAQLLARAHVTPGARLLKNRRLRSLLSRMPPAPNVVVGGLDGMAALGWLTGRPATTTVLVSASDAQGAAAPEVARLQEATLVVACDPDAEDWLVTGGGIPAKRIARHGLLDGPDDPDGEPRRIGLVGWSAPEIARIAGAAVLVHPAATFTWFVEEEAAWALWQGPTASPLAHRIALASPRPRTADLATLSVVLSGATGPNEADLIGAARIFGVPVADVELDALDDPGSLPIAPANPPERRPGWTVSVAAGLDALRAEWSSQR